MRIVIKHIADLYSGIYVNTSSSRGSAVHYLQVRHWDKEKRWANDIKPELREENRLHKNYLQLGDILLATKGFDPFAVLYDGRYAPAIASSVFTVLHIKDKNKVLPAYLHWYLNHPATTRKLTTASKGTSIPLITRDVIEQLEVPVPSLEKQRIITQVQHMQQQAIKLRTRINQLNEAILNFNLLQTANR